MKEISIAASSRQTTGKGFARRARSEGNIPGVVYGPDIAARPITISEREIRAAMKAAAGSSSILTLNVDGDSAKVLVRDIQRDPLTNRMIHVDFQAISATRAITLSIPVHVIGIAKGVKAEGGIQNLVMREVEISCLPADIPSYVEVDVSELSIGESIHVRNISLPNVTVLSDADSTIVTISAPTVVAAPTPAVPAEGEAAAEGAAPAAGAAAPAAGAAGEKGEKKEEKKEEKKGEKK